MEKCWFWANFLEHIQMPIFRWQNEFSADVDITIGQREVSFIALFLF